MKKQAALVLAALSAVYIFIPEPTDLVPILGWMDEGLALAILAWSLRTLGVTLPFVGAKKVTTQLVRDQAG